jgi:hypothetical protein
MHKKIGLIVDEPEPIEGFDICFYYVKRVSGRILKPATRIYNAISCFGDNKTARERPDWIAVSEQGSASRRYGFHWDWLCPTNEEYTSFLFELIKETSRERVKGIHLDCIEFPGEEYCQCERCGRKWKKSGLEWKKWRQKIITQFVRRASKLVNRSFSVTLYPDPFFPERFGLDPDSLARYVDFFFIPIYDKNYSTTYWIEILANAFRRKLKKPFYIGLYAKEPKIENLRRAVIASRSSDGIIFAYGIKKATQLLNLKI